MLFFDSLLIQGSYFSITKYNLSFLLKMNTKASVEAGNSILKKNIQNCIMPFCTGEYSFVLFCFVNANSHSFLYMKLETLPAVVLMIAVVLLSFC